MDDSRRELLLELLQVALTSVDGRRRTQEALAETFNSRAGTPFRIAAIGKAAPAMLLGAFDALGERIESALLITKDGHTSDELRRRPQVEIHETSHPVPDDRSLRAGSRLLAWLDDLPSAVELVFLISGGASSLVEVLEPGATLEDLAALNREGLASGIDIGELNRRRARLSQIKGGRLAARLRGRAARAFFVSDVPDDDPAVIGSGIMGPALDAPDRVKRVIIASIDDAVRSVRAEAEARGLRAWADETRFDGDAERLAVRFTHELRMQPEQVRVWGGESVVRLPPDAGRGGRNQHLALAAARCIAGQDDLLLLAAGTDGTDGPTDDAGGLVDGETCDRIALAGLEVSVCLARADAATALAAAGDLVHTGATGTNVGDIVIGLKMPRTAAAPLRHARGGPVPRVL